MASITFKGLDEFGLKLRQMEEAFSSDEPYTQAIKAGANPVADAIRANIDSIPIEKFRYLRNGDKFNAADKTTRHALKAYLGITPVRRRGSDINARVGWDADGSANYVYLFGLEGYEDLAFYPFVRMLAGSIERGTSVRQAYPFVQPAVNKTRRKALKAMEKSIDETCEKIFKEA